MTYRQESTSTLRPRKDEMVGRSGGTLRYKRSGHYKMINENTCMLKLMFLIDFLETIIKENRLTIGLMHFVQMHGIP